MGAEMCIRDRVSSSRHVLFMCVCFLDDEKTCESPTMERFISVVSLCAFVLANGKNSYWLINS